MQLLDDDSDQDGFVNPAAQTLPVAVVAPGPASIAEASLDLISDDEPEIPPIQATPVAMTTSLDIISDDEAPPDAATTPPDPAVMPKAEPPKPKAPLVTPQTVATPPAPAVMPKAEPPKPKAFGSRSKRKSGASQEASIAPAPQPTALTQIKQERVADASLVQVAAVVETPPKADGEQVSSKPKAKAFGSRSKRNPGPAQMAVAAPSGQQPALIQAESSSKDSSGRLEETVHHAKALEDQLLEARAEIDIAERATVEAVTRHRGMEAEMKQLRLAHEEAIEQHQRFEGSAKGQTSELKQKLEENEDKVSNFEQEVEKLRKELQEKALESDRVGMSHKVDVERLQQTLEGEANARTAAEKKSEHVEIVCDRLMVSIREEKHTAEQEMMALKTCHLADLEAGKISAHHQARAEIAAAERAKVDAVDRQRHMEAEIAQVRLDCEETIARHHRFAGSAKGQTLELKQKLQENEDRASNFELEVEKLRKELQEKALEGDRVGMSHKVDLDRLQQTLEDEANAMTAAEKKCEHFEKVCEGLRESIKEEKDKAEQEMVALRTCHLADLEAGEFSADHQARAEIDGAERAKVDAVCRLRDLEAEMTQVRFGHEENIAQHQRFEGSAKAQTSELKQLLQENEDKVSNFEQEVEKLRKELQEKDVEGDRVGMSHEASMERLQHSLEDEANSRIAAEKKSDDFEKVCEGLRSSIKEGKDRAEQEIMALKTCHLADLEAGEFSAHHQARTEIDAAERAKVDAVGSLSGMEAEMAQLRFDHEETIARHQRFEGSAKGQTSELKQQLQENEDKVSNFEQEVEKLRKELQEKDVEGDRVGMSHKADMERLQQALEDEANARTAAEKKKYDFENVCDGLRASIKKERDKAEQEMMTLRTCHLADLEAGEDSARQYARAEIAAAELAKLDAVSRHRDMEAETTRMRLDHEEAIEQHHRFEGSAKGQISELKQKLHEKEEKVTKLEQEVEKLQKQLQEKDLEGDRARMSHELEVERLQHTLEGEAAARTVAENFAQSRLQEKDAVIEDQVATIARLEQEMEGFKKKIATLEESHTQNADLCERVSKLDAEVRKKTIRIRELEERVEEVTKQTEEMGQELGELRKEHCEIHRGLNSQHVVLEETMEALKTSEREEERLTREVNEKSTDFEKVCDVLKARIDEEKDKAETEMNALRTLHVSDLEAAEASAHQYARAEIDAAECAKVRAVDRHRGMETEMAQMLLDNEDAKQRLYENETNVSKFEQDVEKLQKELQEKDLEGDRARKSYNLDVERLRQTLEAEADGRTTAEKKREDLEKAYDSLKARLEEEKDNAEQEMKALETRLLADLEAGKASACHYARAGAQVEADDRHRVVEAEMAQMRLNHEEASAQHWHFEGCAKGETSELKQKLHESENNVAKIEHDVERLQKELHDKDLEGACVDTSHKLEVERLKQILEGEASARTAAETKIEDFEKICDGLKASIAEEENKVEQEMVTLKTWHVADVEGREASARQQARTEIDAAECAKVEAEDRYRGTEAEMAQMQLDHEEAIALHRRFEGCAKGQTSELKQELHANDIKVFKLEQDVQKLQKELQEKDLEGARVGISHKLEVEKLQQTLEAEANVKITAEKKCEDFEKLCDGLKARMDEEKGKAEQEMNVWIAQHLADVEAEKASAHQHARTEIDAAECAQVEAERRHQVMEAEVAQMRLEHEDFFAHHQRFEESAKGQTSELKQKLHENEIKVTKFEQDVEKLQKELQEKDLEGDRARMSYKLEVERLRQTLEAEADGRTTAEKKHENLEIARDSLTTRLALQKNEAEQEMKALETRLLTDVEAGEVAAHHYARMEINSAQLKAENRHRGMEAEMAQVRLDHEEAIAQHQRFEASSRGQTSELKQKLHESEDKVAKTEQNVEKLQNELNEKDFEDARVGTSHKLEVNRLRQTLAGEASARTAAEKKSEDFEKACDGLKASIEDEQNKAEQEMKVLTTRHLADLEAEEVSARQHAGTEIDAAECAQVEAERRYRGMEAEMAQLRLDHEEAIAQHERFEESAKGQASELKHKLHESETNVSKFGQDVEILQKELQEKSLEGDRSGMSHELEVERLCQTLEAEANARTVAEKKSEDFERACDGLKARMAEAQENAEQEVNALKTRHLADLEAGEASAHHRARTEIECAKVEAEGYHRGMEADMAQLRLDHEEAMVQHQCFEVSAKGQTSELKQKLHQNENKVSQSEQDIEKLQNELQEKDLEGDRTKMSHNLEVERLHQHLEAETIARTGAEKKYNDLEKLCDGLKARIDEEKDKAEQEMNALKTRHIADVEAEEASAHQHARKEIDAAECAQVEADRCHRLMEAEMAHLRLDHEEAIAQHQRFEGSANGQTLELKQKLEEKNEQVAKFEQGVEMLQKDLQERDLEGAQVGTSHKLELERLAQTLMSEASARTAAEKKCEDFQKICDGLKASNEEERDKAEQEMKVLKTRHVANLEAEEVAARQYARTEIDAAECAQVEAEDHHRGMEANMAQMRLDEEEAIALHRRSEGAAKEQTSELKQKLQENEDKVANIEHGVEKLQKELQEKALEGDRAGMTHKLEVERLRQSLEAEACARTAVERKHRDVEKLCDGLKAIMEEKRDKADQEMKALKKQHLADLEAGEVSAHQHARKEIDIAERTMAEAEDRRQGMETEMAHMRLNHEEVIAQYQCFEASAKGQTSELKQKLQENEDKVVNFEQGVEKLEKEILEKGLECDRIGSSHELQVERFRQILEHEANARTAAESENENLEKVYDALRFRIKGEREEAEQEMISLKRQHIADLEAGEASARHHARAEIDAVESAKMKLEDRHGSMEAEIVHLRLDHEEAIAQHQRFEGYARGKTSELKQHLQENEGKVAKTEQNMEKLQKELQEKDLEGYRVGVSHKLEVETLQQALEVEANARAAVEKTMQSKLEEIQMLKQIQEERCAHAARLQEDEALKYKHEMHHLQTALEEQGKRYELGSEKLQEHVEMEANARCAADEIAKNMLQERDSAAASEEASLALVELLETARLEEAANEEASKSAEMAMHKRMEVCEVRYREEEKQLQTARDSMAALREEIQWFRATHASDGEHLHNLHEAPPGNQQIKAAVGLRRSLAANTSRRQPSSSRPLLGTNPDRRAAVGSCSKAATIAHPIAESGKMVTEAERHLVREEITAAERAATESALNAAKERVVAASAQQSLVEAESRAEARVRLVEEDAARKTRVAERILSEESRLVEQAKENTICAATKEAEEQATYMALRHKNTLEEAEAKISSLEASVSALSQQSQSSGMPQSCEQAKLPDSRAVRFGGCVANREEEQPECVAEMLKRAGHAWEEAESAQVAALDTERRFGEAQSAFARHHVVSIHGVQSAEMRSAEFGGDLKSALPPTSRSMWEMVARSRTGQETVQIVRGANGKAFINKQELIKSRASIKEARTQAQSTMSSAKMGAETAGRAVSVAHMEFLQRAECARQSVEEAEVAAVAACTAAARRFTMAEAEEAVARRLAQAVSTLPINSLPPVASNSKVGIAESSVSHSTETGVPVKRMRIDSEADAANAEPLDGSVKLELSALTAEMFSITCLRRRYTQRAVEAECMLQRIRKASELSAEIEVYSKQRRDLTVRYDALRAAYGHDFQDPDTVLAEMTAAVAAWEHRKGTCCRLLQGLAEVTGKSVSSLIDHYGITLDED